MSTKSSKPKTATKRIRKGTLPLEDRDPLKRFPNGYRATFKSIRAYWPHEVRDGPGRPTIKFAAELLPHYVKIAAYYGDTKKRTPGGFKRVIERLEGNSKEVSYLDFVKLRAYADFLGKVPTALVDVFAHVVSLENRRPHEVLDFLANFRRAICALEKYAAGGNKFHKPNPVAGEKTPYVALLAGLVIAVKAFNPALPLPDPKIADSE